MDREHQLYKEAIGRLMPDFEQVRRDIKVSAELRRPAARRMPRWAAAALTAVCAAGLICAFVPPVRASLVDFFHGDSGRSTAAYISTPQHERPEIENVIVQNVASEPWQLRAYEDADLSWGSGIRSARIIEALYDSGSGELTVSYTVDGSALGLEYGNDLASRLVEEGPAEAGAAFPCVLEAVLIEDASAVTAIEDTTEAEYAGPMDITHMAKDTLADAADGTITLTSVFDVPEGAAAGELALLIPCVSAVPVEDNTGLNYHHLGYIEIPFRIDAAQSNSKSAPADTFLVNGSPIDITEAVLSPTGLRIRFIVPNGALIEDFDFNVYADGELLTTGSGAERISYLDYRMGDAGGPIEGLIRVPFADNDITTVRLIACELGSGRAITKDAIELRFE